MNATDIIEKIAKEMGINSIGENTFEPVPLKDLHILRQEIWSLSITTKPDDYFFEMDRKSGNRICYHFKFQVPDFETGKSLCNELCRDFGTSPCVLSSSVSEESNSSELFLAIHIHPEFKFSPKKDQADSSSEQLILNFV